MVCFILFFLLSFRYDDKYTLSLSFQDGKTHKMRSGQVVKSVAEFFDENGVLCMDLFQPQVSMLKNQVGTDKKE